jgi:hypothetical protein
LNVNVPIKIAHSVLFTFTPTARSRYGTCERTGPVGYLKSSCVDSG